MFWVIQNLIINDSILKIKNTTNYYFCLDERWEVLFQETIPCIVLSHINGLRMDTM